jgi:hypothetical protein
MPRRLYSVWVSRHNECGRAASRRIASANRVHEEGRKQKKKKRSRSRRIVAERERAPPTTQVPEDEKKKKNESKKRTEQIGRSTREHGARHEFEYVMAMTPIVV